MSWSGPLEAAFVARDAEAFRAAVSALDVAVDTVLVHDRAMVCWLARHGWAEGIEVLLEAGCEPSKVPGVLHAGIFPTNLLGSDIRALELLVEAGADVSATTGSDLRMSPMHYAMFANGGPRSAAIVRLLAEHGADPNDGSRPGRSPLILGTEHPVPEGLRALLEAGADPDAVDDEGDTAAFLLLHELRAAVQRDDELDDGSEAIAADFVPRSLRALADHGADFTRLSSSGRSLMNYALAMSRCPPEVFHVLLDGGAPCSGTITFKDEELDLLAMSALREVPASVALRFIQAGCPMDVAYEALAGTYLQELVRYQPALGLELWDAMPELGEQLLTARAANDVHLLTLALVGQCEPLDEAGIAIARRLHAAGLSAKATSVNGKSVHDMVAKHNPSALPLVEELLAAEG